jgi:hypothetical protein
VTPTTPKDKAVLAACTVVGGGWLIVSDSRISILGLLMVMFFGLGWFTFAYALRSAWRATTAGRALLYLIGSFWALVTWILCAWAFGDSLPFRDGVREVMFLALTIAILHINLVLRRAQKRSRSK